MMKRPLEKLGLWLARKYIEIMEKDYDQQCKFLATIADANRAALQSAQAELAELRQAIREMRDSFYVEKNDGGEVWLRGPGSAWVEFHELTNASGMKDTEPKCKAALRTHHCERCGRDVRGTTDACPSVPKSERWRINWDQEAEDGK